MEVSNEKHLLRDLALIYLTLAHGTDEDLTDTEVDAMANALHAWQEEVQQESVLSAIKGALGLYAREDALDQVNAAIHGVREHLAEQQRQTILDDLVELAMADGQYLHEESLFIGDLADAWSVSVPDSQNRQWAGRAWTILQQEGPRESWTPLHDLALIYLTLAYETNEDLTSDEMSAITEKISEWIPGATDTDVLGVVRQVMSTYVQGPEQRVFAEAVEAVGEAVPAHQHDALLADLHYVAEADGVVLDAEKRMIRELADAWGLSPEEEVEPYEETERTGS